SVSVNPARETLAGLTETEAVTEEQIMLLGVAEVVVENEVRIWVAKKMNIKILEMVRAMTEVALEAMRNAMKARK
ncbi:MAG: hypothetical protein LE178_06580, partial [Endomicrobium sp.]|nr:hypothetical protein [Endomicrobium sp.]